MREHWLDRWEREKEEREEQPVYLKADTTKKEPEKVIVLTMFDAVNNSDIYIGRWSNRLLANAQEYARKRRNEAPDLGWRLRRMTVEAADRLHAKSVAMLSGEH